MKICDTTLLHGSYARLSASAADTPRRSRASPTSVRSPRRFRVLAYCQAACACANSAAARSQRSRVHVESPRLRRPNPSPCQPARASCVRTYRTMAASGEALVGFQGRGFVDGVQPDFCHAFLLEAFIFQSGDSSELASRLPYKGKSVRNRGVSQTMPFLVIPRSLLRGGFIGRMLPLRLVTGDRDSAHRGDSQLHSAPASRMCERGVYGF
jgi:hypothetical protein